MRGFAEGFWRPGRFHLPSLDRCPGNAACSGKGRVTFHGHGHGNIWYGREGWTAGGADLLWSIRTRWGLNNGAYSGHEAFCCFGLDMTDGNV